MDEQIKCSFNCFNKTHAHTSYLYVTLKFPHVINEGFSIIINKLDPQHIILDTQKGLITLRIPFMGYIYLFLSIFRLYHYKKTKTFLKREKELMAQNIYNTISIVENSGSDVKLVLSALCLILSFTGFDGLDI